MQEKIIGYKWLENVSKQKREIKKIKTAYFRRILNKILLSSHLLSKNIQIKFKYTYPKFYPLFCMGAKFKLPTKGGKQVEGLQGIFLRLYLD